MFSKTKKAQIIDRVMVGESLVIEDGDLNNVAHIDLIIGPRGSAAEDAFCRTLTDQKQGVNGLLAVLEPNLMVKPATVMFNKVTIKNMKQAVQMFGPAQVGVSKAVAEAVRDGIIPLAEADDIFICVGVFISPTADSDEKIQNWNYRATKEALVRAVKGLPTASSVVAKLETAEHPFAAK